MSLSSPADGLPRTGSADRLLPVLFVATAFLSAALLFSVQPMFTKLVLPIVGGSAAVWSIAMVFFQAVLLFGYGYAHLLTRFCPRRLVLPVHLGVALMGIAMLPVAIPGGWGAMPERYQPVWLLGLFLVAVGLPFFWLSANGPLLQAWYARSGRPDADQPYFLYGASNVGSFAALLSYPVVIEPFLRLGTQTGLWAAGFVVLAVLLAASGATALYRRRAIVTQAPARLGEAEVIDRRKRLSWVLLAFVPSGLLVSVTAHISTDIAAVPLLWVVPLALFLLTFVLVFGDRFRNAAPALARLQVWAVAIALINLVLAGPFWLGILIHLVAFFLAAMVCHRTLYGQRPPARQLTEFYLFMSLGGCLGGIFAGLVAPLIFSTVLEYPLLLLLCSLFCSHGFVTDLRKGGWRTPLALALCLGVLILLGHALGERLEILPLVRCVLMLVVAVLLMAQWRAPSWLAPTALAGTMLLAGFGSPAEQAIRSFYGVHKLDVTADGRYLTLAHGTTLHGAERRLNDDGTPATGRPEPTTYYTFEGGLGVGIASIRAAQGGHLGRVAAIGLGSGSLACHSAPTEDWRFYEIDPEVLKIARDPRYFHFLEACAPQAGVVLGDARLTLGKSAGAESLIVIDAFSSDSIPAHLITREAFALYRQTLSAGGAILVHISNRHLDLTQILARTAAEAGLVAYKIEDHSSEPPEKRLRQPSEVMAFAAAPKDLGDIATVGIWKRIVPDLNRRPWTDDFTNIVEALRDRYVNGQLR